MKKNYIYLLVLILATVVVTFVLSSLYKREVIEFAYSYEKLNKITSEEFEEYMIEHPETIIYIADKTNLANNKFEKKFVKKLENLNLNEDVIYIDKEQITNEFKKLLEDKYGYAYNEKKLPTIIVVSEGKIIQNSIVNKNSKVDNIIDYEVFK